MVLILQQLALLAVSYTHLDVYKRQHIYKVSTYHYNWHGETEILILLKGRIEMSCNSEVFTMEPIDSIIISPQVGHGTCALEQDTTAVVIHVGKDFFQQFDPNFGMYQFVVRSDKTNRHNRFFTSLRHHAAMMMLLMACLLYTSFGTQKRNRSILLQLGRQQFFLPLEILGDQQIGYQS